MALATTIGKSINSVLSTRGVVGGLVTASAVVGLAQGLGSQNISDAAYELTTGNPNIDQEVFGRDVSIRSLFAPMPGGTMNTIRGGGTRGMITAAVNGYSAKAFTDMNKNANQPMISNLRYANRPPEVNGSLVFGQYNSRYG